MKHKVITTKQGKVLVDGSAETNGLPFIGLMVCEPEKDNEWVIVTKDNIKDYQGSGTFAFVAKIIATINHSISLDVPMVIVDDEVEKLALLEYPISLQETHRGEIEDFNSNDRNRWIEGYKAAQQKGVYSEEDLINATKKGYELARLSYYNSDNSLNPEIEKFIQSLKQEYIELEMECGEERQCSCAINSHCLKPIIKTDRIDGQLIAYIKQ